MTKKQLEAVEVEAVEDQPADPARPLMLVRALVPMWGRNDDVVPVGMVYGLPEEAAVYLAALGMVAIEGLD